jgi:hypothetical protein
LISSLSHGKTKFRPQEVIINHQEELDKLSQQLEEKEKLKEELEAMQNVSLKTLRISMIVYGLSNAIHRKNSF